MTNTERIEVEGELRERLLDFVGYVLTSARGFYKEPHAYGPMRMTDILEKALVLLRDAGVTDDSLDDSLEAVRQNRWRAMTEPDEFAKALDEAILRLVRVTLQDSARE
ncbi:DUF6092 family protein [Brevibacillus marinus]|uniref:DUF6092 family protein n=1 Tax=Brevibacillus marinus TaxID=2496837 RepID=UPI000F826439|nr:DUF6092 family protein [Brevibacillus marinus]